MSSVVVFSLFSLWLANPSAVEVSTTKLGAISELTTVQFLGTVHPKRSFQLKTRIEGVVVSPRRQMGEAVKKGALILELDSREARARQTLAKAELKRAKAELAQAKANQERAQTNFSSQIIPKRELEAAQLGTAQAEAQVNISSARLELAAIEVEKHQFIAPFAGRLTHDTPEPGTYLGIAVDLGSFQDINDYLIDFELPGQESHLLQNSQTFYQLAQYPEAALSLEAVSNLVDQDTGLMRARMKATFQKENAMLVGSRQTITTYPLPKEIQMPNTSIRQDERGSYFLWVEGGVVRRHQLNGNHKLMVRAEWLERPIVVLGPATLSEGDRVTPNALKVSP